MRRDGTSNPELRTAARTRSRASSTALPARPNNVKEVLRGNLRGMTVQLPYGSSLGQR